MATVRGPLFSLGASGTVANLLTFNQSITAPVARRKPTGYKPATLPQQVYRAKCAAAAAYWRAMDPLDKAEWATVAALTSRQVFAKYLLEWIAQNATIDTPPLVPMR